MLAIGVAPDDQADRAGRLAVDQDLAVLDDDGVGDGGIGDRDADDLEIRSQHRRSSRGQHHALDLAWAAAWRRRRLRRRLRGLSRRLGTSARARRGSLGRAACAVGAACTSRQMADDGTGGGSPHLITSPLLTSTLFASPLLNVVLDDVVRALHAADGFDLFSAWRLRVRSLRLRAPQERVSDAGPVA